MSMSSLKGEGFTIEPKPLTLSAFVLGLASSTLIHLGLSDNPDTNTTSIDLSAAKESIDVLELLQEKTVGNLSPEEVHLLQTVLRDMRLKFVARMTANV
jgi:hypothetical protein